MSFVHLHVHTEYSLLDGFSKVKKLVERAKALEMPAVALTDHGAMYGAIEFFHAAKDAGVKPIIGMEAYMAARRMTDKDAQLDKKSSHLLLLAENETGYRNLLKLASAAQIDGYYYYPRIDHDFLASHSEGLICTTGCMSAEIPRAVANGRMDEARRMLDWYYQVFGPRNFFFELQEHDIPELTSINKLLLDLAPHYNAQFIATNDVHYVNPDDARLQDVMLAIQTNCLLSDPGRMRMSSSSYYLRTPEEMQAIFGEIPGALSNTLAIAERCSIDLGFKQYRLPNFPVPDGYTLQSYLHEKCWRGLEMRYGDHARDADVRQRLEYELDVIHNMGFDAYFLIVWDLCQHARRRDIWYNARGSAAGSLVAYVLEITMVDPISNGLIFERFLNPGRNDMPDIDLDFQDDRRGEMMAYTAQRYGEDKVAQIITFGTLKARAAIRDVGRVLDIPLHEVDRVAKLIPNVPGKPVSIAEALEQVEDFKKVYNDAQRDPTRKHIGELIDTAREIEGVVRNAGMHAAGVIITDEPIIEYLPLQRPASGADEMPIKTLTQFEMDYIGKLGLLKVDFLGLSTLTVMARACALIEQRHGKKYDLYNIPIDDPASFELLGRGDTAGVFQVEGSGMRRYLVQMKPHNIDNVVAMIALYRPGPLEFIPEYIERMHGRKPVEYMHPSLEPIFAETFGIAIYQEQIMRAAVDLAGYTASEADDLRKAIAKKIKDKIEKHKQKFIKGADKKGVMPRETAEAIFTNWEEFARYGFNKSHAADYGVISVQTAFLKAHYPAEYMTALMSVYRNDTDKVVLYVADIRRMGIQVLPPDINKSELDFSIEDTSEGAAIRFGMGAVKNVGQGPVQAIMSARESGTFRDLNDMSRRLDLRHVGRRALESLIKVGALDSYGKRPALLEALDRLMSISTSHFRAAESGQMSLFGGHTGITESIELPPVQKDVSRRDILEWERELLGLYVSDHPLSPYTELLTQATSHFTSDLKNLDNQTQVRLMGLISRARSQQTQKGKTMGFAMLEDFHGTIELVIFPRTWQQYNQVFLNDQIVIIEGKVDALGAEPKVLVDTVTTDLKVTTSLEPRRFEAQPVFDDSDEEMAPEIVDEPSPPVERAAPSRQSTIAEPSTHYTPDHHDGTPPPPDEFVPGLDDWLITSEQDDPAPANLAPQNGQVNGMQHAASQVQDAQPVSVVEIDTGELDQQESIVDEPQSANPGLRQPVPATMSNLSNVTIVDSTSAHADPETTTSIPLPPYLVSPLQGKDQSRLNMVTVVFRHTGDLVRDKLRMHRIYGILLSYPGKDRFAYHIFESERGYQIEFPNFTIGYCQELIERLSAMVGPENVRVDLITLQ